MIYLDNAATSWPKPEGVYQAMDRFAREGAGNPGRSGHRMSLAAERVLQDARLLLARLLSAPSPESLIFTQNGTDALNIAIKGLQLKRGDHVVSTEVEHNSINRPLGRLVQEGLEVSKARVNAQGIVEPEEIRRILRPNSRLIAVTHCSNVMGILMPIEEYSAIARQRGVPLLIDAAQTAGVARIDVAKIPFDLLAFPGHKSLYGPMGTGILYVRPGLSLAPSREGGTGIQSEVELQPPTMPHRLEAGTPNALGIAGLAAGVRFVLEKGVDEIRAHESRLALRFTNLLRENPRVKLFLGNSPDRQLGLVSLTVKGLSPSEVGAILDQQFGIAARTGLHCAPGTHRHLGTFPDGTIRFSFGIFNREADAEAAAAAINEISAHGE